MIPDWLLINTNRPEDVQRIANAIESTGQTYKILSLKQAYELGPDTAESIDNLLFRFDGVSKKILKPIIYGPPLPVEHCTKNYSFVSWLDLSSLTCSTYYPVFGEHLLNSEYIMMPLGDIKRNWQRLLKLFNQDYYLFVRPNDNAKSFVGQLTSYDDLVTLQRAGQPDNLICVISTPYTIKEEYRLFFRHRKYITGSSYRINGEVIKSSKIPDRILKFAENAAMLKYPELPPVWIMDVGIVEELDQPKIIEVSGSLCAGFYECDHKAIIEAVTQEAEKDRRIY